MALRSARFSGDRILEQCAAGMFRMFDGQDSRAVMRVQEALQTLGYQPGKLDGIFGPTTGTAVQNFKIDKGLSPSDPVVGQGTARALDAALFVDPPSHDPAFGEVSPYVANHVVEPFVAIELDYLLNCQMNSVRRDVGFAMLSIFGSGFCLAAVAASRAEDIPDSRIPADIKSRLASVSGSAKTVPFTGTDGVAHVAMSFRDITIMGRRFTSDVQGRIAKVAMRDVLCHELTHVRNAHRELASTPDSDGSVFLDPAIAASFTASTLQATAVTFEHFVHEIVASHIGWITIREDAGDPFAARFLPAAALTEAAHYYFAERDLSWFADNGYMAACVRTGDVATYRQIAMWLRAAANLRFSDNDEADRISTKLFLDAANVADDIANDPNAPHTTPADGVSPKPDDYFFPS